MPKKVEGKSAKQNSIVEVCSVDGTVIKMMAFKGTGVCCENCRKVRDGDSASSYGT